MASTSSPSAPTAPIRSSASTSDDQGEVVTIIDDVASASRERVIMVSTMGDLASLDALRGRARERFGGADPDPPSLLNKNYQGQILEFLFPTAGKWPALERLRGVMGDRRVRDRSSRRRHQRRGGARPRRLGIAMGNALPSVRAAARVVVRSNAEGGAVDALDQILSAL